MIKLMGDLIGASNRVERVIAYGEAIPRLERLRVILLVGLAGACLILAVAYIGMSNQIDSIKAKQATAEAQRAIILKRLGEADQERDIILRAVAGKSGARTEPTK